MENQVKTTTNVNNSHVKDFDVRTSHVKVDPGNKKKTRLLPLETGRSHSHGWGLSPVANSAGAGRPGGGVRSFS